MEARARENEYIARVNICDDSGKTCRPNPSSPSAYSCTYLEISGTVHGQTRLDSIVQDALVAVDGDNDLQIATGRRGSV